jgi:hypothetical protein
LPADYTFTSSDNGSHGFGNGATLKTAGAQSITAADTVTSSITGSVSIKVKAAAASALMVAGFPSPVTQGTAASFTVTAVDPYGNTAISYLGTVHFTSSDSKASLPANYTFTSADAGVHTFTATLNTVGTQSITATDTHNSSITGTQSGIQVTAAPAQSVSEAGRVGSANSSRALDRERRLGVTHVGFEELAAALWSSGRVRARLSEILFGSLEQFGLPDGEFVA